MNMVEKTGEFTPDKLFAGEEVPVLTKAVTLEAGQGILKRGTVLCRTGAGKYKAAAAGTDEAEAVLTDDTDVASETLATAYISGYFNKNALIFGGGLSYDDFDLPLRRLSIFARTVKED